MGFLIGDDVLYTFHFADDQVIYVQDSYLNV